MGILRRLRVGTASLYSDMMISQLWRMNSGKPEAVRSDHRTMIGSGPRKNCGPVLAPNLAGAIRKSCRSSAACKWTALPFGIGYSIIGLARKNMSAWNVIVRPLCQPRVHLVMLMRGELSAIPATGIRSFSPSCVVWTAVSPNHSTCILDRASRTVGYGVSQAISTNAPATAAS